MDLASLAKHFKTCEPLKKVSVRFVPNDKMPKCERGHPYNGLCEAIGGKFKIKINRSRPKDVQAKTLVEEFAHVRAGVSGDYEKDHGLNFRKAQQFYDAELERWLEGDA